MSIIPKTKDITNFILFVLIKRKRMLIAVALGVFIVVLLLSQLVTPSWKATTKILVERSSTGELDIFTNRNQSTGSTTSTSTDVLNMMILLKGENLARQIVEEFKLDERLKEKRTAPKNLRERIQNLSASIFNNETNWRDAAVENLIKNQQVISIENDSNVISIEIHAETRVLAVNIANTMVELLKLRSTNFSREQAERSYILINDQILGARRRLEQAEVDVAEYKINNSVVIIEKEKILKMDRINAIETELETNTREVEETIYKLAQVTQEMGKLEKKIILSSLLEKNPLVIELESKLKNLEIDIASKLLYKTAKHPEMEMLKAKIEGTRSALIEAVEVITKSQTESINPIYQSLLKRTIDLKVNDITLNAREKALNRALIRLNEDIKSIPEREFELAKLEDVLRTKTHIYQALSTKLGELSVMKRSNTGKYGIQVLDKAYLSEDANTTRPTLIINIIAAIFLGVIFGFASIFTFEFFNDSINRADKIKTLLNTPCLGVLPDLTGLQGIPEAVLIEDEY